MTMDVKKFQAELIDELKEKFPTAFSEDGSLPAQLLNTVALVTALAIEKYDRERSL
jgi:hypothetical protein